MQRLPEFAYKRQGIDWDERKRLLDQLIEKHRGKADYDCIVPFSGGKDSTFQLYFLVREYKLKPLVVRFNHGFMRQGIQENNQRTFKKLGVDVLEFTPNWHVVKRLMLSPSRARRISAGIATRVSIHTPFVWR